jgi:hypothetical protein
VNTDRQQHLIAVAWCTGAIAVGGAAATLLFRHRTAP